MEEAASPLAFLRAQLLNEREAVVLRRCGLWTTTTGLEEKLMEIR